MKQQAEITLQFPVELPGQEPITKITLRRPKTCDQLAADESSDDLGVQTKTLLSNLAGIAPEVISEMDLGDFEKLKDALEELYDYTPLDQYTPGEEIKLLAPVSRADGSKMETITLRRPKVKDIEAAQKGAGTKERRALMIYSILAGVPFDELIELDWADMQRLREVYHDFLA